MFPLLAATAQTTPVPDANFENFLIAQGIDTNGANGNILNDDAAAVTALNVTTNNITDFSGLEAFVNLVSFNAGSNQFTTLPLSTLTVLEELRFSGNDILDSIDVSANAQLRVFIARGSGSGSAATIISIDLSVNTLLEEIDVYDFRDLQQVILPDTDTVVTLYLLIHNPITVDLSGYDNLETLALSTNFNNTYAINATLPNNQNTLKSIRCQGGNIINVNVSNFLVLETLVLQSTNTETINLPQTNTLTDISISNHNISNISFADAPMLENLSITRKNTSGPLTIDISQNMVLKNLDANNNNMTSINVSNNTILEDIDVRNNELTSLNVTQNTLLENLWASNNQLSNIDVSQNTVLKVLDLGNNLIPTLNITQNTELLRLYVNNNLFTGTGLDLTQNTELNYLDASENQIESLDISYTDIADLILHHNLFATTDIMQQYFNLSLARGILRSDLLDVSYNRITGAIPDFTSLIDYANTYNFELKFDNNQFHFGDFENEHSPYVAALNTPNTNFTWANIFRTYSYAPQDKVNAIETPTPNAGTNLTLTTTVRGAQNHYQWFKDGVAITDAPDSPNYTLYNVTDCDSGVYHCEITSDLVPFENTNPPGTNNKNLLLVRNDITVTVQGLNKSCVALVNPANGATNAPVNMGLEWNAAAGACGYILSVGTNAAANNVINAEDVGVTTVYNFTNNLDPNTTYNVVVTPYFSDGNISGCTLQSFTTSTQSVAPACSSLIVPTHGETNVYVGTLLEWTAANGADGYYLSVGTSSGGANIVNNENITDGNTTTYNLMANLPNNTQIFVNITPYNALGNATACQEYSFTTESATVVPTAPSCATITTPTANATNVSISSNIVWGAVANADGYYVNIGTTSGGTDVVNNEQVTGTTYDPATDFQENTIYYVTVTPYNTQGNATNCAEISFTTETLPTIPNCTTITLSQNGTDISITWDAVSNADDYVVTLGTASGGNDVLEITVTGTSFQEQVAFVYGTTYYLNVIPRNAVGLAENCEGSEETFIIDAPPTIPDCTALTSPVNGSAGVSVSTGLTWNTVAEATGYKLQIGTSFNGSEILQLTDVGSITAYNPVNDFPENTTIYVTVIPYNAQGDAANCTEISFTTEILPTIPNCTTITLSQNGTDISITWDAVSNADDYLVTLGTVSGGNDVLEITVTGTSFQEQVTFVYGTTYYLNVIPRNAVGLAENCEGSEETFIIDTPPTVPDCTALTSPVNGSAGVSVSTGLTWNTVAEATGYKLQIGTSFNGSEILQLTDVGSITAYNPVNDFPENTTIYVTVIPYNAQGDAIGCTEESFVTEKPDFIAKERYGISPNGDGINDFWEIEGIENYPSNTVSVYNRWGDMVFQSSGYDNSSNVFYGVANKSTAMGADKLPNGTYFFHIKIKGSAAVSNVKGFLVLKR
ncbi:MAG: gliding motility-associated C-terminal domain-containing protein [Flavobacteriaceae bacterium]